MMIATDLESAAKEMAGNWQEFQYFSWHRRCDLERPQDWMIWNTSSRDSRLLETSNAAAIDEILAPFMEGDDPDILDEHAGHWAVGHLDGYAIRVYKDGAITPAFEAAFEIAESLQSYAVLDETDYSRREYEATIENIHSEGDGGDYELPDDWAKKVFSWLWDNNQRAVYNVDDQGGYPSREQIRAACKGLGYPYLGDEEEEDEDDDEDSPIVPDPDQMSLHFED